MCTNNNSFIIKKRKLDANELGSLSREELMCKVVQLEEHVDQLKNVIAKKSNVPLADTKRMKRSFNFSKYEKRHIAIKLLYLGWELDGFVLQEDTMNTVEKYLFDALQRGCLIENRENYHRCGRTDKGVSSFSQVISLTVRSKLSNPADDNVENELPYCKILNALLPRSVRAIAWSPVPKDFSARFNCLSRTYKYWFPRGDLNIEAMNEAAQRLIGTHDFRNLCKMDISNGVTNFTRTVHEASVSVCSVNTHLKEPCYDMCELIITSRSFLWHQIRCIVSVLFLVGQNKEDVDTIIKLLDVDTYPKKPQYPLADPLPLNLFHCEFENLNWITDEQYVKDVISTLQICWATQSVKCTMMEEMLKSCCVCLNGGQLTISKPYSVFFNDTSSKVYKPLLSRPTGKSLDEGISHYIKKGRIQTANEVTCSSSSIVMDDLNIIDYENNGNSDNPSNIHSQNVINNKNK